MEFAEFRKALIEYITNLGHATAEATRLFLFMEFVRKVFATVEIDHPQIIYPQLERVVRSDRAAIVRGRIDAILGNVIIEFEYDLSLERKMKEATEQLQRYVAILWNKLGRIDYVCLASDGKLFYAYRPESPKVGDFNPDDIILRPMDRLDISRGQPSEVLKWLDRYLLSRSLIPISSDDIAKDFGKSGEAYLVAIPILMKGWNKTREQAAATYAEWAKYLSLVYGSSVDTEELFLRHTYLATLVKLMVYSFYSKGLLPISDEETVGALSGEVFRRWGIENFLEEDFFSWLVRSEARPEGFAIVDEISKRLGRYDLSKVNEDVLKILYQDLVDPAERHDLGEFYTPDWLAQLMVEKTVLEPNLRVLDPACGSGTFLASVIRKKRTLMAKKPPASQLEEIISSVVGLDVHPLAELISKANYLMALGGLVNHKRSPVVIPVYLADSILFPEPSNEVLHNVEVFAYRIATDLPDKSGDALAIPRRIVESGIMDELVDEIREFAIGVAENAKAEPGPFAKYLSTKYSLEEKEAAVLAETAVTLSKLIALNRDSIYSFLMKNVYKPSVLHDFDLLIGNPPWLEYRFVKSLQRQQRLKSLVITGYRLLDSSESRNMTHMELATLFLARSANLYLRDKGRFAFVMPRAVFTSDQHERFRSGKSRPTLGVTEILDLEKNQRERVYPLFSTESCVLFGTKGVATQYPIQTTLMVGRLAKKNSHLTDLEALRKAGEFREFTHRTHLVRFGEREVWTYEKTPHLKSFQSPYMEQFRQGATLVPRSLWFVQVEKNSQLGIDPTAHYVSTSERARMMAKENYQGVVIEGKVEPEYFFGTLLGGDVLPFCHLPIRPVVLPVLAKERAFVIRRKDEVFARGSKHFANWLAKAEEAWNQGRGEKAGKLDVYGRLDYNKGITSQNPDAKALVLYNSSGRNYMSACLVDLTGPLHYGSNPSITLNGFVAEHDTFYFAAKSKREGQYLCAILNSGVAFEYVRMMKAARHIQKKVWELPIPLFNHESQSHIGLAGMAEKASREASKSLQTILESRSNLNEVPSTGTLRREIRDAIASNLAEIDLVVKSLVSR